jgi:hypothetical protein
VNLAVVPTTQIPPAFLAVLALFLGAVVFEGFCLVDLARSRDVRGLPREMWLLLMLITIPLGGILYLRYGRRR